MLLIMLEILVYLHIYILIFKSDLKYFPEL